MMTQMMTQHALVNTVEILALRQHTDVVQLVDKLRSDLDSKRIRRWQLGQQVRQAANARA
jgi:hypothetical protein